MTRPSLDQANEYASRWLEIIETPQLSEEQAHVIIAEIKAQLRRTLQPRLVGLP